jgi:hypothetical protein
VTTTLTPPHHSSNYSVIALLCRCYDRDFVSRHLWLATTHNVDYLVAAPLDTYCPPQWKQEFARVPLGSHLGLLNGTTPIPPAPEAAAAEVSVASFFATAAMLTMPRKVKGSEDGSAGEEASSSLRVKRKVPPVPTGGSSGSYIIPLHPELTANTKEKKMYEVERLASVVAHAAQRHQCHAAVDCGAGSGRLARCLSMQHGLRVTGVECSELHTSAAERWASLPIFEIVAG